MCCFCPLTNLKLKQIKVLPKVFPGPGEKRESQKILNVPLIAGRERKKEKKKSRESRVFIAKNCHREQEK